MIHKGVEFTVLLIEPGFWKWRFQIGEAVSSGRTHTSLIGMATRRAEARIDRALRQLKTVTVDL